ncbi:hypothetical protein BY996DRAFT_6410280 [Phakopsora pachyrhizi]|nr:hypothetical protein BY996DRAFT_6410280 [Phakopsora pachyrhizi]
MFCETVTYPQLAVICGQPSKKKSGEVRAHLKLQRLQKTAKLKQEAEEIDENDEDKDKDEDENGNDYNDRMAEAKWLALLPPNVVHGVVKILLDIIRAEGKSSLDQPSDGSVSTTVGALMGATNTSLDRMAGVLSGDVGSLSGPGFISTYPQIPGVRPSVVPDETLCCKSALSRTQNNLNLATEFLLASPVLVQRARDEESAQSQTDTGTNGLPVEGTNLISVEPSGPGTNEENETTDSSDSVDVLMGKASIAGPSSEIMGDVESFTHDKGDDILATPKASEKLSPWLGPKSTGPDEIKAWMMSTLGKLRDPIRSYS